MLLSIKQYAFIFALFAIFLFLVFSYKLNKNLEQTRQFIDISQKATAENELKSAVDLTNGRIKTSSKKLTQWEEIKQQINEPHIFTYWYSSRLAQTPYELKQYTKDLMIYDENGSALAMIENNTLPYHININNIYELTFTVSSDRDVTYTSPIYDDDENKNIIGFLSARLQLLPLLNAFSNFIHIEPDTLALNSKYITKNFREINPQLFSYELHRDEGILMLETQMRKSAIELILIVVIPTLFLYALFIYIIGIPLNFISKYINHLRTTPEISSNNYNSPFQVKELRSIYQSLNKYHSELSQKEKHLSLTLNSIGDAVITTDSSNCIVRMNPVAEKLTGWLIKDANGKLLSQVLNIIYASSRDIVENPFYEVIKMGNVIHINKDVILISKDNTEYHISDSAAPIRDDSGAIRGMVLVFNDITSQKLRDEQLQHSMKMDALGKLTGGIAHDFNNLLGIILGYSELLTSQLSGQPKQLGYVKQIYNAGDRARILTSKLLTFSRKKVPIASVTDLNQQIIDVRHMLEKTLTPRIELKFTLEENLWPVYLDQNQLQDSILNICINAMHAMPDGGLLTVNTQKIHIHETDRKYFDLNTGDYVLLSITDTGTGMSHDIRQKIFDPFFTTKGENGTGLGMSQVYGFVQQSSGSVYVYSEPGHGTCISIYLPRYVSVDADSEIEQKTVSPPIPGIARGHETILVVDDEPSLLEISCQILSKQG
ncbi:MAG: two-component system sensor histidine kinase NtrB, partial [Gammaproteobacteria bacterium]